MKYRKRLIEVRTLPPLIDGSRLRALYGDLESCINVYAPAVVLDCSLLRHVDKPTLHFLLCCLEEAMKRNGDVRLAALQPSLMSEMRSLGLDSLFHIYESVEDALESFQTPQLDFILPGQTAAANRHASENAA